MKKKVLVMGGSYFIGRKIVDVLLQNDYDVYILNRGSAPVWNEKINQLVCDRNDENKIEKILRPYQFDIVVDVNGLDEKQAEKLCNALDCSKIETFIFISSSAVYDVNNLVIPFSETDNLGTNTYWTDYGTNKIQAEKYYTMEFNDTNTKLIMLRPPYVYGENNYVQRESFIFEHIYYNKPVIIPVSNVKLQFIYTYDLAEIIVDLIDKAKDKVNIYNVGNTNYVTARQWVEECASVVGNPAEIIEYDYKANGRSVRDFFPFNDYDNVLDVSKIKNVSNHETNFKTGLKSAFEWFLNNKENIQFKDNVTKNEEEILNELRA